MNIDNLLRFPECLQITYTAHPANKRCKSVPRDYGDRQESHVRVVSARLRHGQSLQFYETQRAPTSHDPGSPNQGVELHWRLLSIERAIHIFWTTTVSEYTKTSIKGARAFWIQCGTMLQCRPARCICTARLIYVDNASSMWPRSMNGANPKRRSRCR